MPRGGRRNGAGRKQGSLTRKTSEIAERAIEQGITPLEVLLKAMTVHYEAERYDKAAAIARDAAPYVHPRLSSVQVQQVTDDDVNREIERRLSILHARGKAPPAGAAPSADGEA